MEWTSSYRTHAIIVNAQNSRWMECFNYVPKWHCDVSFVTIGL